MNIQEILKNHILWLRDKPNGERADLRNSDLSRSDLSGAILSRAISDNRYVQIGCIGSAKRITTYCFEEDVVWCGCFKGTLLEFESEVNETHAKNPKYLKEYLGAIAYIKSLM